MRLLVLLLKNLVVKLKVEPEGFFEKRNYMEVLPSTALKHVECELSTVVPIILMLYKHPQKILSVTCTPSNTTFTLLDTDGHVLRSFSAGDVGLSGKNKTNRVLAANLLAAEIAKTEASDTAFIPVSLHLNNTGSDREAIVRIITKYFVIVNIKVYDKLPYNGCRKKKLRRKRFSGRTKVV